MKRDVLNVILTRRMGPGQSRSVFSLVAPTFEFPCSTLTQLALCSICALSKCDFLLEGLQLPGTVDCKSPPKTQSTVTDGHSQMRLVIAKLLGSLHISYDHLKAYQRMSI
jgi:hypothetical protein